MIKYQLAQDVVVTIDSPTPNTPARLDWTGPNNEIDKIKQFLAGQYGPNGRFFNPDIDTPVALHSILMANRGYTESRLVEGSAPPLPQSELPDGSII
ncbi:hypothetical protein H6F75_00550 [Nodosilinea sp. FACHB-131]|uniref:hypothetical protein n=1 Tax=Cyanophyceae TaxID=3028117 RepID=UPI0016843EAF|nr:hypothetical protein [Nodosilinea sp. FACHB-131]MBD1871960.1 hypothetical protein [Nodosilinea sp. FACHB-131]